jgi:hypothetical protein
LQSLTPLAVADELSKENVLNPAIGVAPLQSSFDWALARPGAMKSRLAPMRRDFAVMVVGGLREGGAPLARWGKDR